MLQGFSDKEIQTQNFNIYPDYEWINGKRIDRGFKATHSIKAELSAEVTGKIREVIDAGALVNYINFELSPDLQNQYKSEALKLVSQDAKLKAEAVAEGLNKKLGDLISVSGSDFYYSPWGLYENSGGGSVAMAKEAITDVQHGEKEVSASVTAVFKLN